MKPLDEDMLSLLVAVMVVVPLLWGSDILTQRLMHRSSTVDTAIITQLLPINAAQMLVLVALTLIVVFCAVSSF